MNRSGNPTLHPPLYRRRWLYVVVGFLLLAGVIAFIILRRAPRQVAGVAVPSVESLASATPAASATSADLTLPPAMLARAGLQYDTVRTQTSAQQLRTTGTVQPNAYHETRVLPLVSGRVTMVRVQLGERVNQGQTLATIYSAELAETQMKYLTVDANLHLHRAQNRRFTQLVELGAVSRQELEEVQARLREHHAEHAALRARMKLYGLTETEINALNDASQVRSESPVLAPATGIITARNVNEGQNVTTADSLFTVTDLSTVWVIGNVYENDFAALRTGARVTISAPAWPDRTWRGTVAYVDPRVEAQTRTAQMRIEVANPQPQLKLGMFVDIALELPAPQSFLAIPRAALQTVGTAPIVFVALDEGRFQKREVQVGEAAGEWVRVLRGVSAGERVVTEGSFFLRAEWERRGQSHIR